MEENERGVFKCISLLICRADIDDCIQVGKKGYVQLQTNVGNLNVEIHCDW